MKFRWCHGLLALTVLVSASCSSSERPANAPAATIREASDRAQPALPTIKLWLGAEEIVAEQAISPAQVQAGLMFRKEMPENSGMLFVFSDPHRASFWMRNTVLPLTCAYIDPNGVILEIHDMKPLDESGIEASSDNVQFVLEMNRGWFARHNVSTGAVVRTERGSLVETYFGRR